MHSIRTMPVRSVSPLASAKAAVASVAIAPTVATVAIVPPVQTASVAVSARAPLKKGP